MGVLRSSLLRNLVTVLVTVGSVASVLLFLAGPSPRRGGLTARTVEKETRALGKEWIVSSASYDDTARGERVSCADLSRSGKSLRGYAAEGFLVDLETGRRVGGRDFFVAFLSGPVDPGRVSIALDREMGCFRVQGLAPGRYLMEVRLEGFRPAPCVFQVPEEARFGVPLLRGGRMRVRVTDDRAVPAEKVRFFDMEPCPDILRAQQPWCRSEADPGWFLVEGLPEGMVGLYVEVPGWGGVRFQGRALRYDETAYWVVLSSSR